MGINYYIQTEQCKTCGHKSEGIHLGKSSAGWQFSFQYNGGKYYKTVRQMKKWLEDKDIEDEYGDSIDHKTFWKMIQTKQKEKLNHAKYCQKNYPSRDTEFTIDGYSFSDCEFS